MVSSSVATFIILNSLSKNGVLFSLGGTSGQHQGSGVNPKEEVKGNDSISQVMHSFISVLVSVALKWETSVSHATYVPIPRESIICLFHTLGLLAPARHQSLAHSADGDR